MGKYWVWILSSIVAMGVIFGVQIKRKAISEEPVSEARVGGDKDSHGCIGSAGYSWCEVKQKCLRQWEEPCDGSGSDAKQIMAALEAKNGWADGEMKLTVAKNDGRFATGGVGGVTPGPGGGIWFAAKVDGAWQIVWDGNGIVRCDDLTDYPDYPADLIPQCYDEAADAMVLR